MSTLTDAQLVAAGVAIGIPAGKVIAITGGGNARWPDSRPALVGRLAPLFANNYLPATAVEDFVDALVADKGGTPEARAEAHRFAKTDNKFAATASVRRAGPSGHTNVPGEDPTVTAKTKAEAKEQAIKDDLASAASAAKEATSTATPATKAMARPAAKSTVRHADTAAADAARAENAAEVHASA